MIKFTITSTKGGVGKTTLTANLGALLADMGLRVLLIDADVSRRNPASAAGQCRAAGGYQGEGIPCLAARTG